MIEEFHVQNYKALRDVTLKLTPVHVLIGPNDSGKTSILEAIAALCRSVDHDLRDAFTGDWNNRALVWRHRAEPVLFTAALSGGTSYQFSCVFPPAARQATVDEEWAAVPGDRVQFASRNWDHTAVCHYFRSGTAPPQQGSMPGQASSAVTSDRVAQALGGVQLYRWNPRLLSLPSAADSKRRFNMDASGFGLPLFLDNILGYDRARFDKLEKRLRGVFPELESIRLLPEAGYRAPPDDPKQVPLLQQADGKGLYFRFSQNGHDISASQVSDGVLLVLAYLTILFSPEPPRVLLVEEPENGVHPQRLREVLQILRELVKESGHTQVVITTHSPYVLDLFGPDEVTLCRKEADGSVSVHRLSDSPTVREQLKVFTLGEIWTAEGDEKLAASTTRAPEGSPQ